MSAPDSVARLCSEIILHFDFPGRGGVPESGALLGAIFTESLEPKTLCWELEGLPQVAE